MSSFKSRQVIGMNGCTCSLIWWGQGSPCWGTKWGRAFRGWQHPWTPWMQTACPWADEV